MRPDSSEGMNMSSFLLKLSKKALISRWQRRWFIVDGKQFYYKRHADDVEHAENSTSPWHLCGPRET